VSACKVSIELDKVGAPKSDHMTFVHLTTKPFRIVILSGAKNLPIEALCGVDPEESKGSG